MSEHVTVTDKGHVRTIALNRPDKKNALTHAMYADMATAIMAFEADENLRVLVLTGSNDCFTAGNDLGDFLGNPPELVGDERPPVAQFMFALLEAKKPVIAALEGPAVGIGLTLLLHCDLVVAGEAAFMQAPFVNLALPPEFASTLLLPFAVGPKRASEILMLGEKIPASDAKDMGLINRVVSAGEAREAAETMAATIAAKAPAAIRLTKDLLKRAPDTPVQRMVDESALFGAALHGDEFRESVAAFFEKRDPDYSRCGQ